MIFVVPLHREIDIIMSNPLKCYEYEEDVFRTDDDADSNRLCKCHEL